MRTCPSCSGEIDSGFRFCPHCGTILRAKVVEYFHGASELDDGWLRVSVYLTRPQHVRFSVWRGDHAEAAMSLYPAEAVRLANFLNGFVRQPARTRIDALRQGASAFRRTIRDVVR
jgi:hypothetical protein